MIIPPHLLVALALFGVTPLLLIGAAILYRKTAMQRPRPQRVASIEEDDASSEVA